MNEADSTSQGMTNLWGNTFFPLQKFSAAGETWSWHTKKDWPLLVLLAVFSVAGQALMNLGLTLETAAKATAMNYSQVGWIQWMPSTRMKNM